MVVVVGTEEGECEMKKKQRSGILLFSRSSLSSVFCLDFGLLHKFPSCHIVRDMTLFCSAVFRTCQTIAVSLSPVRERS